MMPSSVSGRHRTQARTPSVMSAAGFLGGDGLAGAEAGVAGSGVDVHRCLVLAAVFEHPVRRRGGGRRAASAASRLGFFDPPIGRRELLDLDAAQEVEQFQR